MPSRKFVLGMLLSLGTSVAYSSAALAADVIDFARAREQRAGAPKKKCGIILKSNPTPEEKEIVEAELVQFAAKPQRVTPEEFLKDFSAIGETDGRRYFYYGGYGSAPFSKYDQGRWLSEPVVPDAENLYVMEVRPKLHMRGTYGHHLSFDVTQMRQRYELVRYTKLQVSPLIKILALAIHHTRMMESNLNNQIYLAETLTYAPLLRAESLRMGAMDFIDLWKPHNVHEEQFKWFLKDLVYRHLEMRPTPNMEQQLKSAIRARLEATYKNSPY